MSVQSSMRARMRSLSVAADPGGMAEQLTTLRMLCRLWCHENTRVYADRLGDSRDRMWFLRLLETCIKCCFCGVDLQAPPTSPRQPLGGHTATQGIVYVVGCVVYVAYESLAKWALAVCLSVCLSVCLVICLSVCLSVCLPISATSKYVL